jgi:hypothetical protein
MDLEQVGRIEKEGPLTKEGSLVKNLKTRHFCLYSSSDGSSALLCYYENSDRQKRLGSLAITAESSVSEIEDIVRDGNATSMFFLTTPGRVLYLFGSKLTLQDWAHTLSSKILSLRYNRTLHILLDKIFKSNASAKFISVAIGLCLHLHSDEEVVTRLLGHLGYTETSVIGRNELSIFLRRFQPLVPEDEFVAPDAGVVYKLSSVVALISQPWFAGFEDPMAQEERWANETTGTFAVRFSASYVGFYAIAVKSSKRCDHWRLMVTPRGFEVEEYISFATVGEVVTYYALHPLPDSVGTRLVTPGGTSCMNLQQYMQQQMDALSPAERARDAAQALSPAARAPPRRAITTILVRDRKQLDGQDLDGNVVGSVAAEVGGMAIPGRQVRDDQTLGLMVPFTPAATAATSAAFLAGGSYAAPSHMGMPLASSVASPNALAKLEELMEPRGWLPFAAVAPSIDWSQVKLKEKLGSGGSGMNVYRATVNGLCCAVKVMEKSQFRPDQIRHFEEEVNMLRLVSECPHIVKYLHHTVSSSEICLYMEYLPASLFDIIKQRRATLKHFSAYTIASVSLEIIKGIHYLHSHDPPILMRDIKSANVFVSVGPNDQFVDVKVGDFGVSREMSSNNKAQTFIGTPGWMCPSIIAMKGRKRKPGEVEDPNEGYTVSVDIFAFGMVMYELLALKQPYSKENDIFGLVRRGVKPELPPGLVNDARYAELIKLHLACIAFEPAERPTAKEVLVRLSTMLSKIAPPKAM